MTEKEIITLASLYCCFLLFQLNLNLGDLVFYEFRVGALGGEINVFGFSFAPLIFCPCSGSLKCQIFPL